MIIRNLANGLRLLDHFVTVQNRWMRDNKQPLVKSIPEMWDPKLGGMNGLSEDDWLDIMAAYQYYVENSGVYVNHNMWSAANDLEQFLLTDLDAFVRDMRRRSRGSRYKMVAWKFMCSLRDTINEDEGLDPLAPSNRFNDLFE